MGFEMFSTRKALSAERDQAIEHLKSGNRINERETAAVTNGMVSATRQPAGFISTEGPEFPRGSLAEIDGIGAAQRSMISNTGTRQSPTVWRLPDGCVQSRNGSKPSSSTISQMPGCKAG
jgi:hypothetical protein